MQGVTTSILFSSLGMCERVSNESIWTFSTHVKLVSFAYWLIYFYPLLWAGEPASNQLKLAAADHEHYQLVATNIVGYITWRKSVSEYMTLPSMHHYDN